MRFRNIATGEIRERSENHPEYPRLVRQTHRWEQLPDRVDLGQSVPAILEAVETPAQAQEALEAEAARETPRSTLVEALAAIVSEPGEPGVGSEE